MNDPPKEQIADKLKDIRHRATIKNALTYRQVEAITARVDNYMNGTYGNTKRPEHLSHWKTN